MTATKINQPPALNRPKAIAFTIVGALVLNVIIWLIGKAAGGSFEFFQDGKMNSAAPGGVIMLTVVPTLIGMTVAALLVPYWSSVIRVAQVIGPVLALATIYLTIDAAFDGASTVALSAMHVILAIAIFVGLESMQRGRASN
jgi:small-conductance mechanosensitive channel